MTTVFISYRRDDCAHPAGRLRDRLLADLGADNVFFDVDSVGAGENFANKIEETLARCDVVLVLIGARWNPPAAGGGSHALDDPRDWVRVEVAHALRSKAKVIPVLIDGTPMPSREELPAEVADISGRNAVPLRSGADFTRDVDTITKAVGRPRRRWSLRAAAAGVLLLAVAALAFRYLVPTQTVAEKMLAAMSHPDASVGMPDLITNERMTGEKYGIINYETWRRTSLVVSDAARREFFQPRVAVIAARVWILYLAKAANENEILVYEIALGEEVPYLVDRLAYKEGSGYYFDSDNNMVIKGEFAYYFGTLGESGRRYRIGSRESATSADFYPRDLQGPQTWTSPNGRFIVASIAGGNWAGSPVEAAMAAAGNEYALATHGQNPDGKFAGIAMYDRKQETNSTLFQQEYMGDWSIGSIIWSDDSERIFFDNAGAVACIWQYEIGTRILRKIVPEHEARSPQFLRYEGREYILYVETQGAGEPGVVSRVMIATE